MIQTGFIKTGYALQTKTVLLRLSTVILNGLSVPIVCNGQVRNYAARKGYRAKREKAKVKREEVKIPFLEQVKMEKEKQLESRRVQLKYDDSWKPLPIDNVWIQRYYQWKLYSFKEAVECHRETHHPEMYNQPSARLNVRVELNMEGEKKNRFVDDFQRVAAVSHKFDHGEERTILALAKNPETIEQAREAGASLAGGPELIKEIQSGALALSDFQTIAAHPDILPELVVLRGLMKKRFPNPRNGTLDPNLPAVVNRFLYGIKYSASKNEYEKDFGLIETFIGTLDMDLSHLEENFASLIQDIHQVKPKREGEFIRSPPSCEKFKVDYSPYVLSKQTQDKEDLGEDEVEKERAMA